MDSPVMRVDRLTQCHQVYGTPEVITAVGHRAPQFDFLLKEIDEREFYL